MKAKTRRKIEVGRRVLRFSQDHPDPSPGYATTLASLQKLLERAEELINLQRDRIGQVRGTTVQKRSLRRRIRRAHLRHLFRVAEDAAKEKPELPQKFVVPPESIPYLEFQTAAHAMLAEAQANKDLLVKYGMAETLLDGMVQDVEQFNQVMDQGTDARRGHVAASAELDLIGDEILHKVKVMDTVNRYRFGDTAEFAEWESASNVFGPIRPSSEEGRPPGQLPSQEVPPPSGGEAHPAA
jgi:phosphotransferase system IIA component